jgi:hypothetical protein
MYKSGHEWREKNLQPNTAALEAVVELSNNCTREPFPRYGVCVDCGTFVHEKENKGKQTLEGVAITKTDGKRRIDIGHRIDISHPNHARSTTTLPIQVA